MDFKSKAKFFVENGKDMLHIDCGMTYYNAVVTSDNFSEEFRNNYQEIVVKSLNGYKDDTFSINGSFEHEDFTLNNRYNIVVSFKNTFYNFTKTFSIPLTVFHKEKVDYLEERINILEKQNLSYLDRIVALEDLTKTLSEFIKNTKVTSINTSSNLDIDMDFIERGLAQFYRNVPIQKFSEIENASEESNDKLNNSDNDSDNGSDTSESSESEKEEVEVEVKPVKSNLKISNKKPQQAKRK